MNINLYNSGKHRTIDRRTPNRRTIAALLGSASVWLCLNGTAAATSTFNPEADASVSSSNATTNYGGDTTLLAVKAGSATTDNYIRFNLGAFSGPITQATLRLNAKKNLGLSTAATTVYSVADSTWSETGITWNTKPTLGSSLGTANPASSYGWSEIDVTNYVQNELTAAHQQIGFGVHNDTSGTLSISIKSREAADSQPELVLTPNIAPTISITAPSTNAEYTAPATITLTATAADSDGTISKVEFFNGIGLIGTATSAPYTLAWDNTVPGSYSITAKATDNLGSSTVSSPITVKSLGYGFGRGATGGINVVHVTTLIDSTTGTCPHASNCTLRAAASVTNSHVVFDVSGTIVLRNHIFPATSVTIDGSTAPAPGIWITNKWIEGENTAAGIVIDKDNVILTNLRFRPSVQRVSNSQCVSIINGQDILIDHVSCAWPYDEGIVIAAYNSNSVRNVTVQRSLIAESIKPVSHATLNDGDVGRLTWYQNLLSSNGDRNIKFAPGNNGVAELTCGSTDLSCGTYEIIQNLIYNFTYGVRLSTRSADYVGKFDLIENYFLKGPARTLAAHEKHPITADDYEVQHDGAHVRIYQFDNQKDYSLDIRETGLQCENFSVLTENVYSCAIDPPSDPLPTSYWPDYEVTSRQVPNTDHALPTSYTAEEAASIVFNTAGARLPCIDTEDNRILSDMYANTGPSDWISKGNFEGPYPTLISIDAVAKTVLVGNVTTDGDAVTNIGGGSIVIDSEIMPYDTISPVSGQPTQRLITVVTTPGSHTAGAYVTGNPVRSLPYNSGPVCAP